MRILVTGGAGYIGSHAARLFAERGHEVWAFDNLSRGHRAAALDGRLLIGELADAPVLEEALLAQRIEAVVHFAAFTYVGESTRNPSVYYRNNLAATLSLLETLRRTGVSRLVFSSTAAVYGIPQRVPIPEDEPCAPINPYGRGKLAVEWALADFASAYGLAYAALRYFNAAGASPDGRHGEDHDPETHLIPLLLQATLGLRPEVEIFGTNYPTPDGTCVRDYVHVNDLAEAHLRALDQLQPGRGRAFNLGTGRGHSVRAVIDACREVAGRDVPVRYGSRREGDPPALVAAADRARTELGWQPQYKDLHAIVETAWRWHRDHPHGYRG